MTKHFLNGWNHSPIDIEQFIREYVYSAYHMMRNRKAFLTMKKHIEYILKEKRTKLPVVVIDIMTFEINK